MGCESDKKGKKKGEQERSGLSNQFQASAAAPPVLSEPLIKYKD